MLDRASLRTLTQHPDRNDPMLNVALAEEGDAEVLFALAECPGVGPEALTKIAARVAVEGERIGYEPEAEPDENMRRGSRRAEDEAPLITNGTDLEARLIVHPRSDDSVRDAILARHDTDPFFVLAAAAHPRATETALEHAARWPATTMLHDRPWLALVAPDSVPPLLLDQWAGDDDPFAREAAARLAKDEARLRVLAADPSRRVRRAAASNPAAEAVRALLAERDDACEVRARAMLPRDVRDEEDAVRGSRGVDVESARFKAAVAAMHAGGTVSSDVIRAMRAGPLDTEGARVAGRALDEGSVGSILASRPLDDEIGIALAAGIAFRDDLIRDDGHAADSDSALLLRCVHALAGADRSGSVLTGKGRLAGWLASGVGASLRAATEDVIDALERTSLASDRMVLGRVALSLRTREPDLVPLLADRAARASSPVPIALLELAWRDERVSDGTIVTLSARARPSPKTDASPELEVDLDPRARSLEMLEKVCKALVEKAPLSPRAALVLVALEPRRVRYILSALPQWRGVLTGVNIARVLRAHAGALSAAGPTASKRSTGAPAGWTQRKLDEVEIAVALAIGDLSPKDVAQRMAAGRDTLLDGVALAAGMEARAAIDGIPALEQLVDLLARERARDATALAAWLVTETLDRPRSAAAIAAALDGPWTRADRAPTRPGGAHAQARSMVAPGIAEALATLERRAPGRLADVTPQTPRGRTALVSGIARAYRALGGMSVGES